MDAQVATALRNVQAFMGPLAGDIVDQAVVELAGLPADQLERRVGELRSDLERAIIERAPALASMAGGLAVAVAAKIVARLRATQFGSA